MALVLFFLSFFELNSQALVCHDSVIINVDSSCDVLFEREMFLEGSVIPTSQIRIPLLSTQNNLHGVSLNIASISNFCNSTFEYKMRDSLNGNQCSGTLFLKDNLAPILTVANDTFSCDRFQEVLDSLGVGKTSGIGWTLNQPIVADNCTASAPTMTFRKLNTGNDCSCNTIVRTFSNVIDQCGNASISFTSLIRFSADSSFRKCILFEKIDTIKACDSFYWHRTNKYYSSIGTYRDTAIGTAFDTVLAIHIIEINSINLVTVDTNSVNAIDLTNPSRTLGSILPINTVLSYFLDSLSTNPIPNPSIVGGGKYWIKASNNVCNDTTSIAMIYCNVHNTKDNSCKPFIEAFDLINSGDTIILDDAVLTLGLTLNKELTIISNIYNIDLTGDFTIKSTGRLNWVGLTQDNYFSVNGKFENNGMLNIVNGRVNVFPGIPNLDLQKKVKSGN